MPSAGGELLAVLECGDCTLGERLFRGVPYLQTTSRGFASKTDVLRRIFHEGIFSRNETFQIGSKIMS